MSNLDRLNGLRRTAKDMGLTGYGRMKADDLAARIDLEVSARNERFIDAMRSEAETATPERSEEIAVELARIGAVLYPQGTKEHEEYRTNLRAALAEWAAGAPEPTPVAVPDAEQAFAEAVDADDRDAMAEILNEAAPAVIVRDPKATRYEDIEKWTDERLDLTEGELTRRLSRKTLLGGDRRLTENRLAHVKKELEARGL